jgi:hypothetical protein
MVKAEKGGLLHASGHATGRGRVSTQLIFSHLQGADTSYRLNRQKNWGQGTKVCIVNSSCHRCVPVDHYLSLRAPRRLLEILSLEGSNLIPRHDYSCSRVQPHHFRQLSSFVGVVCPARLCCSLCSLS